MGFGSFYSVPNVGVQFTLASSPKAQLNALAATWALAERLNNALGEISQQQETDHALAATWALAERLNNAPGEIS